MARPKFRLAVANRPYDCSCVSQFWPNVTGRRYFADNIDLSSTTVNFNGLLYGVSATVIRRLQMVLNAAARFVVGAGKFQHITPVLRNVVHWLPVRQWILYKVAATAFDCIRGTGPAYFKHVCMPASDISGRAHLCSAKRHDMLVPRTRTELGQRNFSVAAPTVWNSLPAHVRSTLIGRRQFRDGQNLISLQMPTSDPLRTYVIRV